MKGKRGFSSFEAVSRYTIFPPLNDGVFGYLIDIKMLGKNFSVDSTKPLVFQVGHLGEAYDEWVHQPIYSKVGPRFFANDFLESLTRTRWWAIPIIWLPVVCWFISLAIQRGRAPSQVVIAVVCGIFIWTFLEYSLHRFLFHMKTKSYWGNTLHYLLHGCHHKHPMDSLRLVFPPAATAILGVPLWSIIRLLSTPYVAPALFGGGLLGYVMYDITHYYLHHGQPSKGVTLKLKKYHLNHHYRVQNKGFGITVYRIFFVFFPKSERQSLQVVRKAPRWLHRNSLWILVSLLYSRLAILVKLIRNGSINLLSARKVLAFLKVTFGSFLHSQYGGLFLLFGCQLSAVEYTLHRFLFHIKTKSYWGNTMHYLLHGCHHKHPMDGLRLVFPPAATAILIVPFWNLIKLCATPSSTPAVFGGGLLGYVMYDVTHYYLHHGQPSSDIPRNLKKYHLNHHFRIQNKGFGITSSLWDRAFGTLPPSRTAERDT
ncbi:hypothetical protein Nepgr_003266 [Nepenthes gracilis]|uniref:Fatty acid hydroxylase domain-containing protein n=1 Tax=Nepenthes gracilis TaxID=150966 RepID=A0AAD3RZB1_NEPGR|nr:hypothetical protein Nepgr_003266 [Nepenthes gracilis]